MIAFLIVDFGTTHFMFCIAFGDKYFLLSESDLGVSSNRRPKNSASPRWENNYGKLDDLIAQHAEDLKNKCGMAPDMILLTKVTIGCGPAIYNADASTFAGSKPDELEAVRKNFLITKSEIPARLQTIAHSSCVTG